jgi:pectinesterase
LGNQDTIYTGKDGCRHYFEHCYIEGTTDFIFGPAIAWFEACEIVCKRNSYITAASTPQTQTYGYVFNECVLRMAEGIKAVYLGRPWRPYASTLFMNCKLPIGIQPTGWDNWRKPENEKTARYMEYNNHGEGADQTARVQWAKLLNAQEASQYTVLNVMRGSDNWNLQHKNETYKE